MDKNHLGPKTDEFPPSIPGYAFLLVMLATAIGVLAAILVLPGWLPGLAASMSGSKPHVFWFLSRASALVAYWLIWLSMCLGIIITNKLARLWPGGPAAFDLHQYTSLLGLAFAAFHGFSLLGDRYLNATFWQAVLPFTMGQYRPLWVGLGQLSFFLLIIVTFSFYVRKQITPHIWRLIHSLSFISFLFALLHGIASGTDSASPGVQRMYWITGGIFLFLLVYRVLITIAKPASVRGGILPPAQVRHN